MNTTLALTALLMGLAGGPHCLAMCGAACAGIGRTAQLRGAGRGTTAMLLFQLGRMLGYGVLGALAATSMKGVGWLSTQSVAFRPVWTFLHVIALLVGVLLMWRAEQPVWLESFGRAIWRGVQQATTRLQLQRGGSFVLGVLWALLPCGLLYAALLVATLSSHPWEGAVVMGAFALGSAVVLMLGPMLWLRLRGVESLGGRDGAWGVRLAGLALALSAAWGLWMGLVESQAPWCTVT